MTGGYLARPEPSGLADLVEIILDKGIVVDAYARVSLVGIEILTIDARIVIASVDTYLRFAEATNRLDLDEHAGMGLTEVFDEVGGRVIEKVASDVVEDKVTDVVEKASDTIEKVAEKAADLVTPDRASPPKRDPPG
jgi:hypothetical protein